MIIHIDQIREYEAVMAPVIYGMRFSRRLLEVDSGYIPDDDVKELFLASELARKLADFDHDTDGMRSAREALITILNTVSAKLKLDAPSGLICVVGDMLILVEGIHTVSFKEETSIVELTQRSYVIRGKDINVIYNDVNDVTLHDNGKSVIITNNDEAAPTVDVYSGFASEAETGIFVNGYRRATYRAGLPAPHLMQNHPYRGNRDHFFRIPARELLVHINAGGKIDHSLMKHWQTVNRD